ncbi:MULTISPECIES: MarR family transcriptional regulator [Actinomycetes]|uniref:MarR family transcriptional regulator n=1 Tax=Williamsia marianensis TaxID=85044 RepID=A0A2G3PRH9_WILMA|nr:MULTISPECIES: MarR family transcriptional regulator [Actinomycetes]MCK0517558.1 MarR family transcriptional regulator [Williamsia sp. DF01-3]MDV7134599.1 MarR family transcriptional regulator [Williamsia muralis]PHV68386.1 MarR family transcriptional regulator [Williamsia marianensis]PVY28531.1 DNA-binding MarR family transcriptional regulator [Williamsia marianensis]RKR96720.1 DNA-binding MarR family transcriptional regulator [Williamsia muralis]
MDHNDEKLASDLAIAVVRLTRHLRGRRSASPVSLTQLSALATLNREGPMTPGAIAARERVQPPSMTRVIASLADLGLVKREPHPTDGRQVIVTLSPSGTDVVVDEANAREEWLRAQLKRLDDDQMATLRDAVGIIESIVAESD